MKGGEPLITQHTPNQRGVGCTTGRRTAEARRRSTELHVWTAVPNLG